MRRLLPTSTALFIIAGMLPPGAACAQLVRSIHTPQLPLAPVIHDVAALARTQTPRIDELLRTAGVATRPAQVQALLRDPSHRVALDPTGNPVLRGEYLAMGLTEAQRSGLAEQGFAIASPDPGDDDLGLAVAVIRDTRGRSEADALAALRRSAPGVTFTYQHLYLPAGTVPADAASPSDAAGDSGAGVRVGLIDGGVDADDRALVQAHVTRFGCARPQVSRHGTAVAARLVDGDADALYAADLWCGDTVGGATSGLIRALAWMDREHVPVINISLVGPDNPLLARAVQAMVARGHVLVAAVGNEGPAAPALYPSAYPGVIGVSAVDAHDRLLPESGAGPQVAFCALGVVGHGHDAMRGTSFAAPIVARRAAHLVATPKGDEAASVLRMLASQARDLGEPGRDPRYGFGLLAPED